MEQLFFNKEVHQSSPFTILGRSFLLLLFLYSSITFSQTQNESLNKKTDIDFLADENCEEVLVILNFKNIGQIDIPAYICKDYVYISVPALFTFLKIKNEIDFSSHTISGFYLNEKNTYQIDNTNYRILIDKKTIELKSTDIIYTDTDVFLKSDYFASVFELENTFNMRNLTIDMSTKLELPLIKEMRLEKIRENLQKMKNQFVADTTIVRDHPMFHFGTASWSINTNQSEYGQGNDTQMSNYEQYKFELGGMLAGGEFNADFNFGTQNPYLKRNGYYYWKYAFEGNKYLSSIKVGNLFVQSKSTILYPTLGVQITNTSNTLRKSFGTYILSDSTRPNWNVELYVNNTLIGFTKADSNGFFSFEVPIMYGQTETSLRFYGPNGEEEVSRKRFITPFTRIPKNEFEYTLSFGVIEDNDNSPFTNFKMNYGLTKNVTIGAALEYNKSLEYNKTIPSFSFAAQPFSQLLFAGNYSHNLMFNGLLNYTTVNNIRFEFDYTKYDKNQDAIIYNYLQTIKGSVAVPLHINKFNGQARFNFYGNTYLSNTSSTNTELLLSGAIKRFNFNLTTNSSNTSFGQRLLYSTLSSNVHLPRNFNVTPSIRYQYDDSGLIYTKVDMRKRILKNGELNFVYEHQFVSDQDYVTFGFRYDFKIMVVNSSNNFSQNGNSFNQSASGSLIFQPKAGFIDFNNQSSIGSAEIMLIPFLDVNNNGKKDADESIVPDLDIKFGRGKKKINKNGSVIFSGLEPYVENNIKLDGNNFETIAWQIENKNISVILNPNQLRSIYIPVIVVGEIGGVVNKNENGVLKYLNGIKVNIFDLSHHLVASVLSEQDGYFSYLGLKNGNYTAEIDAKQLASLHFTANPAVIPLEIKNGTTGSLIDNLEFVLTKNLDVK